MQVIESLVTTSATITLLVCKQALHEFSICLLPPDGVVSAIVLQVGSFASL
jgi:hypothetical protein